MIRLGTKEDLIQIDTFDIFGGDREEDITKSRLQVYLIGDRFISLNMYIRVTIIL